MTGFSRIHMSMPPPSRVAATHEIGPPLVNTTATSPDPSPEAVRRSADSTRDGEREERLVVVLVVPTGRPPLGRGVEPGVELLAGQLPPSSPPSGRAVHLEHLHVVELVPPVVDDRRRGPAGGLDGAARRSAGGGASSRARPGSADPARARGPRPCSRGLRRARPRTGCRSPRRPRTPGRAGPGGSPPRCPLTAAASRSAWSARWTAGPNSANISLVVCLWK